MTVLRVSRCVTSRSQLFTMVAFVLAITASLSGQATPWNYTPPTTPSYAPPGATSVNMVPPSQINSNPFPWYDPVTHTPPTTYNTNSWPGSASYQTPTPYSFPTREDTQRFVNDNPVLRNLDPLTKSNIIDGHCSSCLSMPYLGGQPNPFYQNGSLVPNWHLPATWSSTTMNWQGVQGDGSLPNWRMSTPYNPTYTPQNYNQGYTPPNFNQSFRPNAPTSWKQSAASQQSSQMAMQSRFEMRESPAHVSTYPVSNVAKAVEAMERTLSLHEAANDKVGQALGHAELASLYVENDKLTQAFEHAAIAERMANEIHDPKLQAEVASRNAAVYMSSGEFNKALLEYRTALGSLLPASDDKGRAEAYAGAGWAYESLGKPLDAIHCYESSLYLFRKLSDKDGEVRVRIGRGSIYQSMGEFNLALGDYQTALPAASKEQKARILVSEAEIFLSHGRRDVALKHYGEALQLIDGTDPTLEGTVLAGLGRCHMMVDPLANYSRALGYFEQAQLRMKDSKNRQGEAGVIASISELHYRAAVEQLISPFASIRCPKQKCPVDPRSGFASALRSYNDALSLMRASGDQAGEVGVLTNIGLVFDALGKYREALGPYRKALDLMDELQDSARIEEFRIDVASQAAGLYTRAILLEVKLGHAEAAFNLSERARARAFLDELGNPRLNRRLPDDFVEREESWKKANLSLERRMSQEMAKPGPQIDQQKIVALEEQRSRVREQYLQLVNDLKVRDPDSAALLTILPLTLHEVQQQLDPDVTAISYFTAPNVTLAFVVTRTSFHLKVLPITEAQLAWAIATFLDFPGDTGVPGSLKLLHKALIAPVKSRLKTTKLAIIPHGLLHKVPFSALASDDKRYLGDEHSVFSLPSLSVLPYVRARRKTVTNQALVFANNQEEGLARLDQAYVEARDIASQFHTKPVLGDDATASEFQKVAGDYDVIHLIAHIDHDKKHPEISRIILGHGKNDEGALETNQIAGLDLRKTGLVVLSGCQSQSGRVTQGDDIVGLTRAFIYAGSPSVIASLWSVDDEATRALMVSFYSHLRQGLSKADALRSAQIDVRREFPHPYYWAGFVLTGDPGSPAGSNTIALSH